MKTDSGHASIRGDGSTTRDWAALVLRASAGTIFLAHGVQKVVVFGWTGGIPNFESWGIPWAELTYPLTVLLETGGGLLLLLGLWVRPTAAALTAVMLVALFAVHLPYGFFLPNGYEFVLTLAGVSTSLVLLGPGRWSVDARLSVGSFEHWLKTKMTEPRQRG